MAQLEKEHEDCKLFEPILNQQTNVKHVIIEKEAKKSYIRKTKVNAKAKALMEQMMNKDDVKDNKKDNQIINGIANEVIDVLPQKETINKHINEPVILQTNKKKHELIIYDLCNADGDQETRLAKQQEAYRLENQ
ncbi:MAG: hypothetical protein EZS28_018920 [Streblomastix strix]|uniref:Uncharacterized protein n=1 Tax=Streblomastix strix TaxID=222440 RepID=A0A5J4VSS2_9EUKA|nr:MAG: hypothetical protein EZS28_018920 [Streblomastix strix]